jgi:hypothetical protein
LKGLMMAVTSFMASSGSRRRWAAQLSGIAAEI